MSSAEQLQQPAIPLSRVEARSVVNTSVVPSCPLCHDRNNTSSFRDNGCSLRMCNNCDLFFVDPYPSVIGQHEQVSSASDNQIKLLDCSRRYGGERLYYERHFASIARECAGARSLLDVGCGTGHLLERLASMPGLYRAGLELNHRAVELARRKAACDIFAAALEDFNFERSFDAITMVNVFSHIPSFDGMFHSLRRLLSPQGKLILRTTEMAADVSRWNQVHWGIPDDLHFLGFRTLDFICAKYGFAIARRERIPFEDELFRLSRWQQIGRSTLQNSAKRAIIRVPGALKALRKIYADILGQRLFISFIVLTPLPSRDVE